MSKRYGMRLMVLSAALATGLVAATVAEAAEPSSSLFGTPGQRQPLTLQNYSWTYDTPPEPPDPIQLHDLITIVVSESSVVISEGEIDRRKKANADAELTDWVLLKWLALYPDPQSRGDPRIKAKLDNKLRSEGSLETRDSMKFNIAVEVVDIRPNSTLVVEGHRTIRNNSEVWDYSIGGVIRPEDILDNNTVLSENVAELRIDKRESGNVRDGYRRGWFLRFLDQIQPF